MPQACIALGEKFSITTSAQFTRRIATSRASDVARLSETPYLAVLNWGLAEFGECSGIAYLAAELRMLDLGPVLARFQLLRSEQVFDVAYGNQQDLSAGRPLREFGLGMAECETLDAFCAAGEFLRRLCPVHQVKAEPAPVLVTGRRVAEAVLVNPFEQPARTRAEHGAEKKSDVHMAILARKDKPQPQRSE